MSKSILKNTHPFIFSQISKEKHLGIDLEKIATHSHKKLWWKCPTCNKEWVSIVKNRTVGQGCPYCAGKKPTKNNNLATKYPEISKLWHPTKNKGILPTMVLPNSQKKVWWLDTCGHTTFSSISNKVKGKGCPYCSGHKVLRKFNDLATTNPELLDEWDYEKNTIKPEEVSKGCSTKVWWKCSKGHSWEATISSRTQKRGCPYCSGLKAIPGKTDLFSKFPHLASEWDYEKNKRIDPLLVAATSNKKVWWKCNKGHSWEARISSRSDKKTGCPYCSNTLILSGYNDFKTTHPYLMKDWDYEKNSTPPEEIFRGTQEIFWWKCHKCGKSWRTSPNCRTSPHGSNCPYCSSKSKNEDKIDYILTLYNITYEKEKRFDNCIDKRQLPFDWYLPEHNICIEYDGEQHYIENPVWGGKEALLETKRRDEIKTKYCLENNLPLLRIPYWEKKNINTILEEEIILKKLLNINNYIKEGKGYIIEGKLYFEILNFKEIANKSNSVLDKIKELNEKKLKYLFVYSTEIRDKLNIIRSMINNKLGKNKTKIFARKCKIKEISTEQSKLFLINNHLQGYSGSLYKLGLFYNEELVCLVTIGSPRYNKKYKWEIIRFATKCDYTVTGGFSKLITYFKNTYKGSIITYADKRYSSGNTYSLNGFKYLQDSRPNYFYTKDFNILESRTNYQKHKLSKLLPIFDENNSETENMQNNGYSRIFDAGTSSFSIDS